MNKKKKSNIARFASYYRPHLPLFAVDMICALLISGVDIIYPLISRKALNEYIFPDSPWIRPFIILIAVSIILHVARAGCNYIVTYYGHVLGVRIEADMRRDVFSHMQKLGFSFYDKSRTGKLMARCTTDLFDVVELAHHGPEDVFISVVTFIGSFIAMVTINWRLALVLIATVPLMMIFVMYLRKRLHLTSRKVKESVAVINADIESAISGVRVAKAFTNEEYEVEKFERGNENYISAKGKNYKAMGQFMSGMEFFTSILRVIVLGVAGLLIILKKGSMTTNDLVVFLLYISSFTTPIRKLAMFMEQYTAGMAGFTRFVEIMDTDPSIFDKDDAMELENVRGDIEFKDVTFSYDGGRSVLENISLTVPHGKTVALVGPSGGGKTTLCHLIPRFYDVTSGSISVDGHDIRDVTLHSLRGNIGIVQQDVFLFAASVKDNIRYGRLDATDEEIVAAAKAAEIHDDIMKMPDGYDTMVGERGITLSGGQKQRVSIARIFLKNPPILILDEATSALDSATEARITGALERLSRGRTTLVIAHRLSTVRNADEIIVIDETGIIERGSHDELMKKGGAYRLLNDAQNLLYGPRDRA
ncbi:MAG: ABC transporter ATP-binding protein/permease [Clostridiales bacterium]|nr:ABC transporter ATP-binding protein/permease [Clostridiales bacterium]